MIDGFHNLSAPKIRNRFHHSFGVWLWSTKWDKVCTYIMYRKILILLLHFSNFFSCLIIERSNGCKLLYLARESHIDNRPASRKMNSANVQQAVGEEVQKRLTKATQELGELYFNQQKYDEALPRRHPPSRLPRIQEHHFSRCCSFGYVHGQDQRAGRDGPSDHCRHA